VFHHGTMKAYSEDLRKKIVEAVEQRGMQQSEAARLFGVSLSSVKRYVRKCRQGRSLSPGKAPGKRPAIEERAQKLLEEDLRERVPFSSSSRGASTSERWPPWKSAAPPSVAP
jgi:transposase